MRDREALGAHLRTLVTRVFEMPRPERARYVREHTRAVALAVDRPRAMRERAHTVDDVREDMRHRLPILARDGHEAAGVAFVRHHVSFRAG